MKDLFTQIVEQTPCPVEIESGNQAMGFYYSANMYRSRPFIKIQSIGDDSDDENVASLLHEKVHAEHEKNGCRCIKMNDHTLGEYHAYKDSLKAALKLDNKNIVKKMIRDITNELAGYACAHQTAARRIVKLKLWQKALDFVKD